MKNQVSLVQLTARVLDYSVLEAYNESIRSYSVRARTTLERFNSNDGELTGSNPFMLVDLANSGLLPNNTILATRNDLEYAISKDKSLLIANYTDFALALRTAGDSYIDNDLLAKRLANQLKQRDIKLGKGKLIPLDALSLAEDKGSAYGLVFDLKEDAEKSSIRDLGDFKWKYEIWEGLARADFCSNWGWGSDFKLLAGSGGVGRVVIVSNN